MLSLGFEVVSQTLLMLILVSWFMYVFGIVFSSFGHHLWEGKDLVQGYVVEKMWAGFIL